MWQKKPFLIQCYEGIQLLKALGKISLCPCKAFYTNVFSNFVITKNNPHTHQQMNKQVVIYPYNGMLLGNKK
jgi:hypothetical protein